MADGNSTITPHIPGVGRIMITNHGTHPPELYAQMLSEQLVSVGNAVVGKRRQTALAMQAKIADAMEVHHKSIRDDEHAALQARVDHHETEAHPDHNADRAQAAMADVVEAAKGTEWEMQFADPVFQEQAHAEIARHFATHQHVERSHHRDQLQKKGV